MTDTPTKTCSKCKRVLPVDAFAFRRKGTSQRQSWCRSCVSGYKSRTGYHRTRRITLKRELMDAYGGVCHCCGEAELAFLTLDHLNDNGAEHRRELGASATSGFYAWLKNHGYPQNLGLVVACFNCNSGRAANGGTCPHQTAREARRG